ncbi:hypothetical protein GLYMA_08G347200v4 [Glycine max]|uniref:Bromo domain-containing protein n=1 Tax=Glycine max TaxID=3847 RepID=K7LAM8_SOYBN|nr:chromatin structure-remodeling complex subunit rsc1 [Glycine max]KAH1054530.1 hypothetical protein GYH30_023358 [Glycine max]KRH46628.1 hypothetical protein GLYMA_08G347200v4 [Glycine max]|eukprot:XP_006586594.1 chromatin structure-remodeling complex subunit rsc1 [Glycine max]
MATTEHPRRKLIIKIYFPRSQKHEAASEVSDSCCGEKRSTVTSSNPPSHGTNTPNDSRSASKVCELKNKKGYYATATWVNIENPSSESSAIDSRISRTGSEVCELKNKKEGVRVGCKNTDKKRKVVYSPRSENPEAPSDEKRRKTSSSNPLSEDSRTVRVECKKKRILMDRCKKMQCWAMLKRLMVGRDAWALKKDILDPKVLCVLHKSEAIRKPKGLEDIESKLKNWDYSETDEFVDDVKLVLSYALQYPQRSEVHRTARRISEGFEISWKTMKAKWMRDEQDLQEKR